MAIKLLRCTLRGDEVLRRFQRERQVLASLDHEYVARLIDGGTTPEGEPYLVMEYVEGLPIDRHCREAHLGLRARLKLFARVLHAVRHAHERGVVHRDLKPGNLLVRADGSPRLLDFGISRVEDTGADAGGGLTRTGHRLFTPEYASPEQVRGEATGPATDVFALGVLLHELITGERPWRGATDLHRLERAILLEPVLPPSRRLSGAERRAVAGDLDTLVLACLAKAPAERYPDAGALLADLERHLAGRPIHARRTPIALRVARRIRRSPGAFAAAGLVLLALSAGGFALASQSENRRQRARAELDARALERQRAELVESIAARIDAAHTLRRRGELAAARRELEGARASAQVLGDEPLLWGRLLAALAVVANHEHRWQEARDLQDEALERLAGHDSIPAELKASLLCGRAYTLFQGGWRRDAFEAAGAALAHARAALPPGHELRTDALLESARQESARGRHTQALELYDEAAADLRGRGDDRDLGLGQVLNNYGVALLERGLHADAAERFREARAALGWHLGAGDPSLARLARNLAEALRLDGRFDEARLEIEPSLARYRELERHVDVAESLRVLGLLERDLGRPDAALLAFEEGRRLFAEHQAAQHPALAKFDHWLGEVHTQLGDPATAREHFERALTGPHSIATYGPAWEGPTRLALADLLLAAGHPTEARPHLERALVLYERVPGRDHPDTLTLRHRLETLESD